MPQMAECLLTCMESCIHFPALNKPGMTAHGYNPSTLNAREVEAERPAVNEYPWLYNKFETSPGHMRSSLKIKRKFYFYIF